MAEILQRLHGGEGVALVVVDDEDPGCQRSLQVWRSAWLRPPGPRRRVGGGCGFQGQLACGMRGATVSVASFIASARWIETRSTEMRWSMSTGLET